MRERPFAQVDVFSRDPHGGNPVAVVLDAEGLEEADMRRFARWTNLSETTFVLPPTREGADYRVRIFTPTTELPFAGHPTLGTCHAWMQVTGWSDRELVVQQCAAGLIQVRRTADGLAFAGPPLVRDGPVEEPLVQEIAAALGIARADVLDARWADNGPGWVAVLLPSVEQVLALAPASVPQDLGVVARYPDGDGGCGGDDDAAIEVRAFCRDGSAVTEDPVTGSLNASLAGWLLDTGRLTAPYVARQGSVLQRTGRVHVSRDDTGTIWVAGATTTVIAGTVTL